jgi:hypothetical protein
MSIRQNPISIDFIMTAVTGRVYGKQMGGNENLVSGDKCVFRIWAVDPAVPYSSCSTMNQYL